MNNNSDHGWFQVGYYIGGAPIQLTYSSNQLDSNKDKLTPEEYAKMVYAAASKVDPWPDDAEMPADESYALSIQAQNLPGLTTLVDYPCGCQMVPTTARGVIMHLNDRCGWSREKIADWLDLLHDSGIIDIEFKVEVEDERCS